MLQQSCRLLQGYCSTQLFYFIAYETTPFMFSYPVKGIVIMELTTH